MDKFISIIVKPTDACNMRCLHCYHAVTNYDTHKMTMDTFKALLDAIVPSYNNVLICWHGGEPLLMGNDFYTKAYELCDEYTRKYGVCFRFRVQTNATLLNDEYITLFKRTNTRVNISYDGRFNNVLREHTESVEQAIEIVRQGLGTVSCISSISGQTVNKMIDCYEFFKSKRIAVKFNPIIQMGEAKNNKSISVSKEEWTKNVIALFDYWIGDADCCIPFSTCENLIKAYLKRRDCECTYSGCLFQYLCVDSYGNLYPCGRLAIDDFCLTNVHSINDLNEAFLSQKYKDIMLQTEERIKQCQKCKWFDNCHGGCNSSAYLNGEINKTSSFDCYYTKRIFEHIDDILTNKKELIANPYAIRLINQ